MKDIPGFNQLFHLGGLMGSRRPIKCGIWLISAKTNLIVKTQRNATQLNSKATSVGVRHISHVFPTPPHPPPTNFSVSCRPARELKFCTDTH